jgi:dTDP-4-amino-4,6-dideoxygalactose transaminase
VDIDAQTFNIDPTKIEAAITDKTSAILATHVYGNPCDVEAIELIAQKYNLKVIYDGAHAFGVKVKGKSIFEYGDVSTCSLHATKLYHSIEGGLIISKDTAINQKLKYMRNFGISGFDSFAELGINGKNSEFHAAMGLVNLDHIQNIIAQRKQLTEAYQEGLSNFSHVQPVWHKDSEPNYAYFPILLASENQLLAVQKKLEEHQIQTRRYFYPSLASSLPYLEPINLPVTEEIASRVLCLPLYFDLTLAEVSKICEVINV